jgi:hypothetical protein
MGFVFVKINLDLDYWLWIVEMEIVVVELMVGFEEVVGDVVVVVVDFEMDFAVVVA